MRYSADKKINELVKCCLKEGWVFRRGGKHGRLTHPSGCWTTVPKTPSDHRASKNFRSDIRRALK